MRIVQRVLLFLCSSLLTIHLILIGLMHIGVVKTLYENKVLPRIISGSSCGSIIAAILCTRTDEEIPSMIQFEKFNFVSVLGSGLDESGSKSQF